MAKNTYGMNMKRMKRLLVVAGRINPREFNMSSWFNARARKGTDLEKRICELTGKNDAEAPHPLLKATGKLPNGTLCGTTACLAGWGAVDPVLHREGLTLNVRTWAGNYLDSEIRFKNKDGDEALEPFFGLNSSAAAHLFGYDGSTFSTGSLRGTRGKRQMIRHIKDAIAHPEKYGTTGNWFA